MPYFIIKSEAKQLELFLSLLLDENTSFSFGVRSFQFATRRVLGKWPLCKPTSRARGWHYDGDQSNDTDPRPPLMMIHPSSFAFNSSILWDPERWGRSSSSAHPTATTASAAQVHSQAATPVLVCLALDCLIL